MLRALKTPIDILSQAFLGLTYGLVFSLGLLVLIGWMITEGW
jgi:hypothetical protein